MPLPFLKQGIFMEECTECIAELGHRTPCDDCPIKEMIKALEKFGE